MVISIDYHICLTCEANLPLDSPDSLGNQHLRSHALLQASRPVVKIDKLLFASLRRIYEWLSGDHDSDSENSDESSTCLIYCLRIFVLKMFNFVLVEWSDDDYDNDAATVVGNGERVVWSFSEIENLPEKETLVWNVESDAATSIESPISITYDHQITGFRTYGLTPPSVGPTPQAPPAEADFSYKCAHCKKVLDGTRFVMITEYRGAWRIRLIWLV